MVRKTACSLCAFAFVVLGLAGIVLSGDEASAEDPKKLAVVITASTPGEPPRVVGHYIYLKDGVELREEIDQAGGWGWNFEGEYIKEVIVRKVSGEGEYSLFVIEDSDQVFEIEGISSDEEIVYQKE